MIETEWSKFEDESFPWRDIPRVEAYRYQCKICGEHMYAPHLDYLIKYRNDHLDKEHQGLEDKLARRNA